MRPSPLLFLLLLAAFGVALALAVMLREPAAGTLPAASGGAEPVGVEIRGGVPQGHVYTGIADQPDDINPFTASGTTAKRYVLGLTYEGLLDTDPATGALRPALAESWEAAPDAPVCTFTLRSGVTFADGAPVTMADVLFGWELAKAGHLQFGGAGDAFGRVAAAEALDARRLRVTFRAREPGVLRAVGEWWLVGERAWFVARVAARAQRLGHPVPAVDSAEFATLLAECKLATGPGTGPYQVPADADGEPTTFRRRQDLLLTRNPHHWRRDAEPGTWNFAAVRLLFRDSQAAPLELFAHRVDWYYDPECQKLLQAREDLQQHYRPLVYDHSTQGVLTMLWNCRRRSLADVRVRKALASLFDRAAVQVLFAGNAAPAKALAKPKSPEYPRTDPAPFDPPATRRALRELGYEPTNGAPLRLDVLVASGDAKLASVATLFADAARDAGVDVHVRELEFQAFVAQKTGGDWDGLLVLRGLRASGDPFDFVHCKGADNDGGWADAEADRLAEAARAEFDEGRRADLLRALHERVLDQQPLVPIAHPLVTILLNKHIENAVPGPRGLWPERCWVRPEHQRR